MSNRTIYTCPTLMWLAYPYVKLKLWHKFRVYWKTPSDGRGGSYIVVQPRGKKGGWQLSCPFPKWMIFTEMRIRKMCLGFYAHIRHPVKMFRHYQWRYNLSKKRLISKSR